MKTKTKNLILVTIVSIIAVSIPALILNKWIEAVVFFICHWLIREQFEKQYHHIVPAICRVITGSILFFGVCLVLPFTISLFFAIPINYLVGWVGFTKKQADYYEVKYLRLKAKLEKDSSFNTTTCTEQELLNRCKELHLSEENTKLAIEFFIKKTKQSVLADQLCINEKSVQVRKKRLKEKLNK